MNLPILFVVIKNIYTFKLQEIDHSMRKFFDLPPNVLVNVLSKWIQVEDTVRFDIASAVDSILATFIQTNIFQLRSFVLDPLSGRGIFPDSQAFRNKMLAILEYRIRRNFLSTFFNVYCRHRHLHCLHPVSFHSLKSVHFHQPNYTLCGWGSQLDTIVEHTNKGINVRTLVIENCPLISTRYIIKEKKFHTSTLNRLTSLSLLNCDLLVMTSKAVKFIGENCRSLQSFALTFFPRDNQLSEIYLRQIHKESDVVSMLCATANTLKCLELEFYGEGKDILFVLTAPYISLKSLQLRFFNDSR